MHSLILWLIMGYLLGSIPFAKIVGAFYKIDIQKEGSGNIGFANSLRVLGWGPALLVLVGDMTKGFIPVIVAMPNLEHNWVGYVALAAVMGHIFPVWLKFRGGKGVATAIGCALALNPIIGLSAVILWAVLLFTNKTGSLGSLLCALLMPILSYFLEPQLLWLFIAFALIIFITHRTNIKNLIKGQETKVL